MLKTCGKPNCQPIEQIRGEMGPGDYHDVIAANPPGAERWGGIAQPERYGVKQGTPAADAKGVNQAHIIECDETNGGDFRIVCKTCGKATGWNKPDAPGMLGVGKMFVRQLWDESTQPQGS